MLSRDEPGRHETGRGVAQLLELGWRVGGPDHETACEGREGGVHRDLLLEALAIDVEVLRHEAEPGRRLIAGPENVDDQRRVDGISGLDELRDPHAKLPRAVEKGDDGANVTFGRGVDGQAGAAGIPPGTQFSAVGEGFWGLFPCELDGSLSEPNFVTHGEAEGRREQVRFFDHQMSVSPSDPEAQVQPRSTGHFIGPRANIDHTRCMNGAAAYTGVGAPAPGAPALPPEGRGGAASALGAAEAFAPASRRRLGWLAAAVWLATSALACAGPAVWGDFTSVSLGKSNEGRIQRPTRMPTYGTGHWTPPEWRTRGNRYGIDELVEMIERASETVREHDRRATLGVADLSPREGGHTMWHRSHHSGRDVDLIFYSADAKGKPMRPPEHAMVRFGGDGKPFRDPTETSAPEPDWEERRFDARLNWHLVEALLSDPEVRVQWIFVSDPLRARLLEWARRHDRPKWAIAYAERVMYQPGQKAPHDDHFHVRIYCPREDRPRGCVDTGPVWPHEKKTYKYGGHENYTPRWDDTLVPPLFFFVR